MKFRLMKSLLGILLVAIALVGCATNDYDIDVDALLQQLEMEAGVDYAAAAPAPAAPAAGRCGTGPCAG